MVELEQGICSSSGQQLEPYNGQLPWQLKSMDVLFQMESGWAGCQELGHGDIGCNWVHSLRFKHKVPSLISKIRHCNESTLRAQHLG